MRKALLFIGFIITLIFNSFVSSPQNHTKIDEKNIMKFISQLASDDMQGRKSGLESGRKAEEYLVRILREIGLEPEGNDGTYLQKFNFPISRFTGPGNISILRKDKILKEYKYGDDFYFYSASSAGHIKADVAFIGYGICAPEKGFNEYQDLKAEGRILLCLKGAPGVDKNRWKEESSDYYKAVFGGVKVGGCRMGSRISVSLRDLAVYEVIGSKLYSSKKPDGILHGDVYHLTLTRF